MKRAAVIASAAALVVAQSAVPVAAGLGRDVADRAFAEPVRSLDFAALLEGRADGTAAAAALSRFPEKCRSIDAAGPCDDDLRCAWLAARAATAAAWPSGSSSARDAASAAMDRAAAGLARSESCGASPEESARWRADSRKAAADAARLRLFEIVSGDPLPGPLPADSERAGDVGRAVERARRQGVASLGDGELIGLRDALRRTALRVRWLRAQPALARLRGMTHAAWQPFGGVPKACGEELLRPHLLSDEWRGMLVTDGASRALLCLGGRYESVVRGRGLALANAEHARLAAPALARSAAADRGGRTFGGSSSAARELDRLAKAIMIVEPASRESAAPREAPTRIAAQGPDDSPRAAGNARPEPARVPTAQPPVSPRRAAPPSDRTARGAAPVYEVSETPSNGELVSFAARASALLGRDSGLRTAAARATSAVERERVLSRIHVAVHRDLCSPFESLDPGDREAAERVLSRVGVSFDLESCGVRGERQSLARLLSGAAGLRKLRAAAEMRGCARLIAQGHPRSALKRIDALPEETRGTTWALVRAWALRKTGEQAEATRTLAILDESLVDRLRTAGDEALARLAAHAFVATGN